MPALALPGDQLRAYRRTITGVSEKRIRVAVLDRQGRVVEPVSRHFQDGQVLVDTRQDVDRSVSMTLLDPKHRFGFDADTYQGGVLDLTRMIRVWWIVDGSLLDKAVSIPVFTGPVTRLRREGGLVTVEGQGKEVYGLTPSHKTLVVKKGARRTDAIKTILRERMGETRLGSIPDLDARLPEDVVVGPKDAPWKVLQHLAGSFHRQLWFDGAGVPRLRAKPSKVTWRFNGGENGSEITSPLSSEADLQKVKNHVRVIGATPKGKHAKPIVGTATADQWDPLSPWMLGPPDAPMWLDDEFQNDHLRTQAECDHVARERLKDGLRLVHDVSFNSAPVPHLEPGDLVHASTDHEAATTRLETFTLPLGFGEDMTLGYIDPFSLHNERRAHHKNRGGHR